MPLPLHTSKSLHLDDNKINETLAVLSQTVPVTPGRLNDLLRNCGMGTLENGNITTTKAELEPLLADEAQASKAAALERDIKLNAAAGEVEPALATDTAWDHGRLGSNSTTLFIGEKSGCVIHEETVLRADPDIKSSQVMEKAGFSRGINSGVLRAAGYKRMVMDGAQPIIKAAEAASYRALGDPWHGTKCKARHLRAHIDAHAPRCQPCESEKAAKAASKPDRPATGPVAPAAKLGSLKAQQPHPTVAEMREQLGAAGEKPPVGWYFTVLYYTALSVTSN